MAAFMIRFLICNIFISGIVGILLVFKRIFKNSLSCRMQYNLWFLLIGVLAVPFLPFSLTGFSRIFSWFSHLENSFVSNTPNVTEKALGTGLIENTNWMDNFAISINSNTPSFVGNILSGIWIAGILTMIILVIKSSLNLRTLKKSSLPLQNLKVRRLYKQCLNEMKIHVDIPIFSTAFLKSPIIVGLINPRIYLPIHIISDYNESDMRYMLLHELKHYKHKDALAGYLMTLARIIYWFNPLIWFAMKEMRNDREIACDTSVLKMLEEELYEDYGNTLINFAEKVSQSPFPFATGLGGNMQQIKRRIINIASYKKPTLTKQIKGLSAFLLAFLLILGLSPLFSTYAADEDHYQWNTSKENIIYTNLSSYFGEYQGSFVLYDSKNDTWSVHDKEHATFRVAPNSTYKIYDALFGLEEGIITPKDSFIAWDGNNYPFEAWNADQTLKSAMNASVNWYFQSIDEQLGISRVRNYIKKTGYGNELINGDFSTYWMGSSLKISPVEQVELLIKLNNNDFDFSYENIMTVKDTLRIFSSDYGTFYGKTGTGRVNEQDVNGWFIGFVETNDNTYFFATNIEADSYATGSSATQITMSILSDMNIWK